MSRNLSTWIIKELFEGVAIRAGNFLLTQIRGQVLITNAVIAGGVALAHIEGETKAEQVLEEKQRAYERRLQLCDAKAKEMGFRMP